MIELRAQAGSFGVEFIIHERGIPFDPEAMERQAASVGDDLSERALGLKLMKTFMDEFAFTSLGRQCKQTRFYERSTHKRHRLPDSVGAPLPAGEYRIQSQTG